MSEQPETAPTAVFTPSQLERIRQRRTALFNARDEVLPHKGAIAMAEFALQNRKQLAASAFYRFSNAAADMTRSLFNGWTVGKPLYYAERKAITLFFTPAPAPSLTAFERMYNYDLPQVQKRAVQHEYILDIETRTLIDAEQEAEPLSEEVKADLPKLLAIFCD
jgi:hypothetical protein